MLVRASCSAVISLLVTAIFSSILRADDSVSYDFTKADVVFIQSVAKRDQFIHGLSKEVSGFSALHAILNAVASGPVKVSLTWNRGLIEGWRTANSHLEKIGKQLICEDIILHSTETKNADFFERLAAARGCG